MKTLTDLFIILTHDWKNKTLITVGFSFTYFSNILHKINNQPLHDFTDIMEAILKVTALLSFIVFVIRNYRPVKREVKRWFK
jgi:hypothetical protein